MNKPGIIIDTWKVLTSGNKKYKKKYGGLGLINVWLQEDLVLLVQFN